MTDEPVGYRKSLLTLALAMFAMAMGVGFIVPLLPVYAETMGASGVWIGLIFAANPFVRAALMVVFGSLSDYKGKKKIICAGLFGYMVVSVGFVLAAQPIHLFLMRILQGVFSAMISPVVRAYAGELSPAHKEGAVMGTLNTGFFAGFAGGPLIGGLFADAFGFNVPFYAMGVLNAVALLMVIRFVPEQVASTHRPSSSLGAIIESIGLLRDDIVKGVVAVRSSVGLGHGIFSSLLPLFCQLTLGMNSAQTGMIITTRSLVGAGLQPKGGQMADQYNRKWLAVGFSSLASVGFLIASGSSHMWQLMVVSVIIGVSFGVSVPSAEAIGVERGRHYSMGRMMGLVEMSRSFAMAIGSVLAGLTIDLLGTHGALVVASILTASGLLVSLFFLRNYPASLQEEAHSAAGIGGDDGDC